MNVCLCFYGGGEFLSQLQECKRSGSGRGTRRRSTVVWRYRTSWSKGEQAVSEQEGYSEALRS